ncbi:MAG TPA: hypothetical protein VGN81_07325 [Pseudonocardiaceae bacterium]
MTTPSASAGRARVVHPVPEHLAADLLTGTCFALLFTFCVSIPLAWPRLVEALAFVLVFAGLTWLSWLRTSVRFEPEQVVITRLLLPNQHIPWSRVRQSHIDTVLDDDGERILYRYARLALLRDPDAPPAPVPTTLPEYRNWRRRTYRDISVLVRFPNSPDAGPPTGRFAEVILRNRDIVRGEFAAHGFPLEE